MWLFCFIGLYFLHSDSVKCLVAMYLAGYTVSWSLPQTFSGWFKTALLPIRVILHYWPSDCVIPYIYDKHPILIILLSIDLFPGYGALEYAVCAPHGGLWHILYGSTHSAAHLRCLLEVSSGRPFTDPQQHNTVLQRTISECSFQALLSSTK